MKSSKYVLIELPTLIANLKMITQELTAYVRQQLEMGIGKDAIQKTLLDLGWVEGDIQGAIFEIERSQSAQTNTPALDAGISAKDPVQSAGHKGVVAAAIVLVLLLGVGGTFAAYQYNLFSPPAVMPIVQKALPAATAAPASSTPPTPARLSGAASSTATDSVKK